MSTAAVKERPIFLSAQYLAALIRRNRAPGEETPAAQEPVGSPPFAPVSAFVMGDEVIECEEVGQ